LGYPKDSALQKIIPLLENINTINELKKEKSLIHRTSIDCVQKWETINLILTYTNSY